MSEKPLIDAAQEKILSLADETQFAPNGIVSRTLLRTTNLRVVLFGFTEGQELTEHTSTQHAVIQILSGECEFTCPASRTQLRPAICFICHRTCLMRSGRQSNFPCC